MTLPYKNGHKSATEEKQDTFTFPETNPDAPWDWNIYIHLSNEYGKCRWIYQSHGAYGKHIPRKNARNGRRSGLLLGGPLAGLVFRGELLVVGRKIQAYSIPLCWLWQYRIPAIRGLGVISKGSTWRIIRVRKWLGSPPFDKPWSSAIWRRTIFYTNMFFSPTATSKRHPGPHSQHLWFVFGQRQEKNKSLQPRRCEPSGFAGWFPKWPFYLEHLGASWWFQPSWKILVKIGIFPK